MVSSSRSVSSHSGKVFSNGSGRVGRSVTSSRRGSSTSRHSTGQGYRGQRRRDNRKKRGGGKRHLVLKWFLGIAGLLLVLGAAAFAYLYITTEVPAAEKVALASKTMVYYSDGTTPIGSFADQNREIINCTALPKYTGEAVVSSENRSFYSDSGIDLKGIARALFNNITTGSRQGGSTITQQYAERYYLGETKSYMGKLHEAFLALKIAQTQDKSKVLCNYLNTIYWGRGAYGIQAAAQAYFNEDAKDLTLSQSAMLAGIIPAPTDWDPAVMPKEAKIRFQRVIRIMKEDGYISSADASKASMPQTVKATEQNSYAGPQGYLMQMVSDELTKNKTFTKQELDTGGYSIVTTIDKTKQNEMYQVASPSQGGKGIVPNGLQVGAMSVDPRNGDIISLYAGDDYLTKQLNNATQALYEPGSTMKPFALLAAIEDGMSLNTTFNGNSPRTYTGITSPVQNFDNESYGYINMYSATANSVNTVYMELQQDVTAKKVAQTANTAGISASHVSGTNPFTVLGNDGVNVSEIAQAYATIANQGVKATLHIVSSVKDSAGKSMYKPSIQNQRVFPANDANLATKAMEGTIQSGTATEAKSVGKTLAGKSGTANDSTAGSFVGYSPNTVSVFAIWYPNAKGNPQVIPSFSGYSGGSDYPVHLFTKYMTQAMANTANEAFPTATDNGKVGGPNGTWGTGSRTWQQQQQDEATNKKKAEEQQEQNNRSSQEPSQGSGSSSSSSSTSSSSTGTNNDNSGNKSNTNGTDEETAPSTTSSSSAPSTTSPSGR